MGRYCLIGSYYDMYKKTYSGEIKIKEIAGVKLSTLASIDSFTSKYTSLEIIDMLRKELGINGVNHLVVGYSSSNNLGYEYQRVIYKDDMINECVNSLKERTVNILGKTMKTLFVDINNQLYKNEVVKMLEEIKSGNIDIFNNIYSDKSDFSFLVRRYLNSDYDNESYKEEDLKLILLEFSRYTTFRKWIVGQSKLKEKSFNRDTSFKKEVSSKKKSKNKEKNLTYDEFSEEYDKIFIEKNNIGYNQYRTFVHNHYDDEKEEFLNEDEYVEMNVNDEEELKNWFNDNSVKKRR